ncbi:MAG: UpxY family transcription antiterminator [Chitinophagaceae bacterium]|nr:UpxY family transcription antiterminator [Chitinophagaceae bacterium]MEA3426033.1 UpxY family transcription antiterminator [Bacteroidota bacterium]MCA6453699.1 UpxY family transcription antiterminator [Chitinophagaceae bacterium]MCA6455954.1 UpxY family transcription antiterminator [Chitinophagaceae bacterium]MCA6459211.1 UpxY family transcription antiterminator [Chitinophagaceae bacterium]
MQVEKKWYALYTKPRWEKKIDAALVRKGIESWCPLQKVERQWSDRKKVIEDPLFKSYVFVHIDDTERAKVLMTDGVLNFVYYLGKPAVIKHEEVDLIKKYLAEKDASISILSQEGYKEEMRIKVNHGVFMGNEGTVIRGGRKKVYVKLESLGQVMVVEFPAEFLSPI